MRASASHLSREIEQQQLRRLLRRDFDSLFRHHCCAVACLQRLAVQNDLTDGDLQPHATARRDSVRDRISRSQAINRHAIFGSAVMNAV